MFRAALAPGDDAPAAGLAGAGPAVAWRWIGISTQNAEPRSTSLVNPTRPFIISASRLVIVRPMPVPSIGPGLLAGALERAEPWGVWGGELVLRGTVVANKRGRGRPRGSSNKHSERAVTGART